MASWIQKVNEKWKPEGVKLNPPATNDEIEKTETILNFKFPEDFRKFYLVIDGFRSFDMEHHMFTFWSLETIIEEYNRWGDKEFIGFSDYLIASHAIGFKRNEKGIFKLYDEPIPIAETFEEVVNMINSGSQLIY
ncbi:SMI1/KNR4 family protein [uncultured Mucilaginibacter sp.]|uniref:SMI1/KNR4 family protein n=1 Tax=uncultured Mucilaginibacter sp. TaxID=797541 RepID=UPI0025D5062E|nr:SMI1/KNR4 family protein [uncultured Mucilaginibacter sp.]